MFSAFGQGEALVDYEPEIYCKAFFILPFALLRNIAFVCKMYASTLMFGGSHIAAFRESLTLNPIPMSFAMQSISLLFRL